MPLVPSALFPLLGQGDTHDLLIIPGKHTAVGKGGMAPDDLSVACATGCLQNLRSIQFLVTIRRHLSNQQFTRFDQHDKLLAIENHESRGGTGWPPLRGSGQRLPTPLTRR